MSTLAHAMTDSATMLRRNLRHGLRYPAMTAGVIGMPIIMLLLFVYVFGDAMSKGIGEAAQGADYIDYLVPGILLMTLGSGSMPTAVAVCTDMTEGIVARFRTMPITRASVLSGHVIGSVIQTTISVLLVIGVALLMGFRPGANPLEWLAAIGLIVLVCVALTWLAVGLGLMSKTPEAASNAVIPLSFLLPFVSSAFVPIASMPGWVGGFAEYQPFTAVIETLRGLLMGTPIGNNGFMAVAWCLAVALAGYVWSKRLFNRDPVR